MEFLEKEIIQVTEEVWKTLMGLEIKVADEDLGSEKEKDRRLDPDHGGLGRHGYFGLRKKNWRGF